MQWKTLLCAVLFSLMFALGATAQNTTGCLRCFAEFDDGELVTWGCKIFQENGGNSCTVTQSDCVAGSGCVYTDPNCFLEGTLVATPAGQRPIESLKEGDEVFCVGPNGARIVGHVSRTIHDTSNSYQVINGTLRVTEFHRFLTPESVFAPASYNPREERHKLGAWREVRALSKQDQLVTFSGAVLPIQSIEKVSRGVRVYNLEVEPYHNYFANDVLVHNAKPQFGG